MPTANIRVDDALFTLLEAIYSTAKVNDIQWLLVGATARALLFEQIYECKPGNRTSDVDFAVQVGTWKQYEALCQSFEQQGFIKLHQRTPAKRYQTNDNLLFDLLPFGGIEIREKEVYWPPNNDELMTVRGFRSASLDAIATTVNNRLIIPLVSVTGLFALKVFAWDERHHQQRGRDASDLAYIINDIYSIPFMLDEHEEWVQQNDYDFQLAALAVLGTKVSQMLDDSDQQYFKQIVQLQITQGADGPLARELKHYLVTLSSETIIRILKTIIRAP